MQNFIKKSLLLTCLFAFTCLLTRAQVNAGFSINYPSPACNPAVITFTNTSTGVAPLTYKWNFGMNPGTNSTLQNPSTTYGTCGSYVVTLTVTNGAGKQSIQTDTVVINCKPTASFTVSTTTGCMPLPVQFTSNSLPGSGTLTNYIWDFGDGSSGSGPNPTHTYSTSGCKNVTLVVTNSKGCSDDTTRTSVVCVLPQPTVNFSAAPQTICGPPLNTTFSATVTGGISPYSYSWKLPGASPDSSSLANPAVSYNGSGNFNASLIVKDTKGCTDTLTKSGFITVGMYNASFTVNATQGCAPLTVKATGTGANSASSWSWVTTPAASPATSNIQAPSFTFTNPGTYQVCLTVTYPSGCTAKQCTTIVVNPVPVAKFGATGNFLTCNPPLHVTYLDSSTGKNLTYKWTFTGGSPSLSTDSAPPTINYNKCGNYNASLTVTSAAGCVGAKTLTNFVNINCPVASFKNTITNGCVPLQVNFNSAASTGSPTQWQWNFGDTTDANIIESTQQNPTHIFTKPGCYDVKLVTINAKGCNDTVIVTNSVCAGAPPKAHFTANPKFICAGQSVNFTDSSTGTNVKSTYGWNFEHVPHYTIQSTTQNPIYVYNDTGWMNVTLIVCNSGCCDTLTIDSMVHVAPPVAVINFSRDCKLPYELKLDGTKSLGALTYQWDMAGGTPDSSSSPKVTVDYPASGTYLVNLTVTNGVCTNTTSVSFQLRKVHADFNAAITSSCNPFKACLTNTSVDANTYSWVIKDSLGTSVYTSTTASPCPVLQNPGVYTVQLIATDINGCKDTLVRPRYLTVFGVNVNFTATPPKGCKPLSVQFKDSSNSTTSTGVSWKWNFGDPASGVLNKATSSNPAHVYNNPGSYFVSLVVTDNHGCIDSAHHANAITVPQPLPQFKAVTPNVCLGSVACFTNTSTGTSLTYVWHFGDGDTATTSNACHTYPANGTYIVTLTATDAGGCVGQKTDSASITVSKPKANFVADTTHTNCPPLAVNFKSLSTGINSSATYHWDFGDGSSSTLANPFHFYTTAGAYDVTLITTNQFGCSDTVVFPQYINIAGPSGTATASPLIGCIPLNVCFTTSTKNTAGYAWNFGDGNVIHNTNDSTCYVYNASGLFFPQVILSDGLGCSVALSLGKITVGTPTVKFGMSADSVCRSGSIHFTDSSAAPVPITGWAWNFGDTASGINNTSILQNPNHFYSSPGVYIISLKVTTQTNCDGVYFDTLKVIAPPIAAFNVSNAKACPGTSVSFTDNSQSGSGIASWLWNFGDAGSGTNNTSTFQNASHTYANPGTYNISLIVSNPSGCTDTSIKSVRVVQHAIASAGSDTAVCLGLRTVLNGKGGVLFTWTPSTGLSDSTIATPIASPITSTTYSLTVIDSNSCVATAKVVITVNPIPVIKATGDTSVCPGSGTQLHASGGLTYTWDPLNGLNNGGIANPTAEPLSSVTYTVTGVDLHGCSNVDSVFVNVFPATVVNAGPNAQFCAGQSTTLNGTGVGVAFSWSPADGLSDPDILNPVATPAVDITYTLTVVDSNHCSASDEMTVVVHPLPNVSAGPGENICFGNSTDLFGSGASQYHWVPATYLSSDEVAQPICTPDSSITYYLTATDTFGCVARDSVIINVIMPVKGKVGPGGTICEGEVIQLSASGGTNYSWSPPYEVDNPNIANPFVSPAVTTTFKVIISNGNCSSDSGFVTVVVNQKAFCDAGKDIVTPAGSTVTLNATAGNGTYAWSPAHGLSCTDCLDPVVTAAHDTSYILTVTAPDGCRSEDTVHIHVACIDDIFFVPNAFTPNGDNKDDIFRIRSYGLRQLDYMRIFNRWGQLVFESNDIDLGWDGKIKGENAAPGVYVYYLRGVCSSGEKVEKQGNVTLIR